MESLYTLIVGTIAMASVQLYKQYGSNTRFFIIALVVAIGMAYTAFKTYVDPNLQTEVVTFATSSWGFAATLYIAVEKFIQKK